MATTTGANDSSSTKRSNKGEGEPSGKRIKVETESVLASLPPPTKSQQGDEHGEAALLKSPRRWKSHQMMEDYCTAVGNLMFPGTALQFTASSRLERVSALGYLTSKFRRTRIWEDWSPKEVALFEAALMHHGKQFSMIRHSYLPQKSTKDVVAFYYVWKKTQHYKEWKRQYVQDDEDWDEEENSKEGVATSETREGERDL